MGWNVTITFNVEEQEATAQVLAEQAPKTIAPVPPTDEELEAALMDPSLGSGRWFYTADDEDDDFPSDNSQSVLVPRIPQA